MFHRNGEIPDQPIQTKTAGNIAGTKLKRKRLTGIRSSYFDEQALKEESAMKCREMNNMLSLYIDRMLEDSQVKEIEEHLAACETCRNEYHG
jgi:hypothetical protein